MSDEQASQTPNDAGPITVSPDLEKWRRRRERVPKKWRRAWDYVFVSARVPKEFNESVRELATRLRSDSPDVAKAVLAEAEAIYAEPQARIESAERRATTLQGTVAIAASLAIAGGGLLADPAKIQGQGWRTALALTLLAFVISLTGCAVRAVGATGRIFHFEEPGPERIFQRASMRDEQEALAHRAAELLRAYGVADEIGKVKVGLLRAAGWWFRLALLTLALLTALLAAYVICGPG